MKYTVNLLGKNFGTKRLIYNHSDQIWSFDLADMSDYKTSNNRGFTYIFIIIDGFPKCTWAIPIKIKYGETIKIEFSFILTTAKWSPVKRETDIGAEFLKHIFQNFLEGKNMQLYSRFIDKVPSIGERNIRAIRKISRKPVFEEGNAGWISEVWSIIKQQ